MPDTRGALEVAGVGPMDVKQFHLLEEGPPRRPKGFPPLLEVPSWRLVAAVLLVGAFFGLSLTVAAQRWSSLGVSSSDLIKYGSIPLVSCVAANDALQQNDCMYSAKGLLIIVRV